MSKMTGMPGQKVKFTVPSFMMICGSAVLIGIGSWGRLLVVSDWMTLIVKMTVSTASLVLKDAKRASSFCLWAGDSIEARKAEAASLESRGLRSPRRRRSMRSLERLLKSLRMSLARA